MKGQFTESQGIRFYCEQCEKFQPVIIGKLDTDKLWADILCKKCKLVLATIESDKPGICKVEYSEPKKEKEK